MKRIIMDQLIEWKNMSRGKTVAQMLTAAGHKLYYYSESEDRMEVDFLLTKSMLTTRKNIVAVEVKSGKNYTITSLEKYRRKFSQQVGECYVLHDGDIMEKSGVTYLPVYMAGMM